MNIINHYYITHIQNTQAITYSIRSVPQWGIVLASWGIIEIVVEVVSPVKLILTQISDITFKKC